MPMDKSRYPSDWDSISHRIRERAGHKCEVCGVPDRALIYRDPDDKYKWTIVPGRVSTEDVVRIWGGKPISEVAKVTKVVLTVHHIGIDKPDGTPGSPHDKMDVRDANLTSLCQRCHFLADLEIHKAKAQIARRENKHKRILKAGQLELI